MNIEDTLAPNSDQLEQWRAIPGYEGIYEVSDVGRIRSLPRFDSSGHCRQGQLLRDEPVRSRAGHLRVTLCRDGKTRHWFVHRLVLTAFIGETEAGMQACHNDGDPTNNALGNLRWDTASANARDRRRHGTDAKANQTHCKRGHEYNPLNTIRKANGCRNCRTCRNAAKRAAYHAQQKKVA